MEKEGHIKQETATGNPTAQENGTGRSLPASLQQKPQGDVCAAECIVIDGEPPKKQIRHSDSWSAGGLRPFTQFANQTAWKPRRSGSAK